MRVILTICLLLSGPATAQVLSGPASVVDSDTIRVAGQTVRIFGIDTPEHDQTCETSTGVVFACGDVATRATQALVEGSALRCQAVDVDRYGRIVARCDVGGRDLGADLVAAGHAFAYRRYSQDYVALEDAARRGARGFWSGQVQNPAVFRARDVSPAANQSCNLKGNISSSGRIVHQPGDDSYAATRINTAKGERWFCSLNEAIAAGWRPARR